MRRMFLLAFLFAAGLSFADGVPKTDVRSAPVRQHVLRYHEPSPDNIYGAVVKIRNRPGVSRAPDVRFDGKPIQWVAIHE